MPDKRLMRSRTEKMWAGVCGGFAEYFSVDPVLVRLVAVVVTIATFPIGLIGYIVCMIVMPEAPARAPAAAGAAAASTAEGTGGDGPAQAPATASPGAGGAGVHPGTIGGLILVVVGALLLMANLDIFDWGFFRYIRWRYLWPVALIVIGVVMIGRARQASRG